MKTLKRTAAFFFTFLLCFQAMILSALAGNKISINDVVLSIETTEIDDVSMVPIRDIYQCFGATVTWQADTKEIVVTKEDTTIKFKTDSKTAYLNTVPITLTHAVVQKDGLTYMPINFVSTSLDTPINWSIENNTVEFTVNSEETPAIIERNNKLAEEVAEREKARQAEIARKQEEARQAEIAKQKAEQAARQKAQAASVSPQGNTVYITRTGKRYHYSSTCNGGTYYPSTLQKARARGLTPCNKCT